MRGRRSQVDDPRGDACEPPQRCFCVQISLQWCDFMGTQRINTLRAGGQRRQAHATMQLPGKPQSDIATSHNQNTLAAKACRQ